MRIISRIDIKNDYVIKGIHLEGLRKVGKPNELASKYYHDGIDEIIFMDAVASLYDRNQLCDVIEMACENVFVPIAVGGGIRSVEDVTDSLNAGADKVVINTGAVKNINLIKDVARVFGSQCIIGSIEAKSHPNGWEAYIDNGREPTKLDVIDWAYRLQDAGVGEILVTSVDKEGTKKGFDVELISEINSKLHCPVIASGGYGSSDHIEELFNCTIPSAISFASVLHYNLASVDELRHVIRNNLNNNS